MTGPSDGPPGAAGDDLADRVAGTVLAVDGVTELHAGPFGEIGTHLPGRRIPGVRFDADGTAQVHVAFRWGVDIPLTADAVRHAVGTVYDGPVRVTVEDLSVEPGPGVGSGRTS